MALAACVQAPERIDIVYRSHRGPLPIAGAENVDLALVASDRRTSHQDRVGAQKNGRGMDATPIVANQGVVEIVRGAVAAELTQRGFHLTGGPDARAVVVDIGTFYNDFRFSYAAGEALAAVAFTVRVETPDKRVLFDSAVTGNGRVQSVQFATPDPAKRALEAALDDAIGRLFAQPAFIAALIGA